MCVQYSYLITIADESAYKFMWMKIKGRKFNLFYGRCNIIHFFEPRKRDRERTCVIKDSKKPFSIHDTIYITKSLCWFLLLLAAGEQKVEQYFLT